MKKRKPRQLSFEFTAQERKRPLGSRPSVCRKYHRELWKWLAENPTKYKGEWPKLWDLFTNKKGIKVSALLCFPCEIAKYKAEKNLSRNVIPFMCVYCPIKSYASVASGYACSLDRPISAPCEVIGPYRRWKELKEKLAQLSVEFVTKKREEEIELLLGSIAISALAVASLWGDDSLNKGGYNTNI